MPWDVFISHASEDKESVARPLAALLQSAGVRVWLDVNTLTLGDSLSQKIDDGLANSRYGVIILSKNFFSKAWPPRELSGLVQRELHGRKIILPVWHEIDHDFILQFSPTLADKLAISTSKGLASVSEAILQVLRENTDLEILKGREKPTEPPSDFLSSLRLNPLRRMRTRRLEQYREIENHEWMGLIEARVKNRDEKEREIDLALHQEGRTGINWLTNREIRMTALVLASQREVISAGVEIRKRLGQECPELLSDEEILKLEKSMLQSVRTSRAVRRDDYERRAQAAGVPMHRPEQQDAAEYEALEALIRREMRKLFGTHEEWTGFVYKT